MVDIGQIQGEITEFQLLNDVDICSQQVSIKINRILRALQRSLGKWREESQQKKKHDGDNNNQAKNADNNENPQKVHLTKMIRDFENFACSQRLNDKRKSELKYKSQIKHQQLWKKTCTSPNKLKSREKLPSCPVLQRCPKTLSNNQYMLINFLKDLAETAIRCNKTFTVCGNSFTIRKALWSRGWVEKIRIVFNTIDRENLKLLLDTSIPELLEGALDIKNENLNKRIILSKLIANNQVDFFWDQNYECYRVCPDSEKLTLFNRFKRNLFYNISKLGFAQAMRHKYYWFQNPGTANIQYPRSYDLSKYDETREFIQDYNLTAALSLLQHIANKIEKKQSSLVVSENGQEPMKMYHFAVKEVTNAIRYLEHEDIDYNIEEPTRFEWNDFLETFYRIAHIGIQFKLNGNHDSPKLMLNTCTQLLEKMRLFRPNLDMDGMLNIWILKPINGSRGEGIYICRTLQYIMKMIRINTSKNYIIQKYIEKPLLIYNTKFDVRQWFVVSSTPLLTIWIYRECYLRFSSQNYTLNRLNEAIHLTNNSVQSKYRNCERNQELPTCNMWDCNTFQDYLQSIGNPNVYEEIIYPGIKQAITAAILMNEIFDTRKNCFEIYGADFIITNDFKPWLIEINSKPAMHSSTPITARMCPQVLEDLIKVVIDYQQNPTASTGQFELLYQAETINLPCTEILNFELKGQQLPVSYFYEPKGTETHLPIYRSCIIDPNELKEAVYKIQETLHNLCNVLQCDHNEISNNCGSEKIQLLFEDRGESEENNISKEKMSNNKTEIENNREMVCLNSKRILEDTLKSIQYLTKAYNRYT